MTRHPTPFDVLEFTSRDGNLMVRVPWEAAERLRLRLRSLGIGATLHLDAALREAVLLPWTNLSQEQFRSLLETGAPAPPGGAAQAV